MEDKGKVKIIMVTAIIVLVSMISIVLVNEVITNHNSKIKCESMNKVWDWDTSSCYNNEKEICLFYKSNGLGLERFC